MRPLGPVIAIDGPAGAGKSTVALKLAQRLGFLLVDTGALYRGVAFCAVERGIPLDDGDALGELARSVQLTFARDLEGRPHLRIDGRDRSTEIRTPAISQAASHVSRHPQVRAALLDLQRGLGRDGGVVLEGRDIGTVVFPDADAKVFLTANARARAERRVADLHSRGVSADLQQTLAEIEARDRRDATRPVAPLRAAVDAVCLDTSDMDIDAVVTELVKLVGEAVA